MRTRILPIVISVFLSALCSAQQNGVAKMMDKWGEPIDKCPGSKDAKLISFKNTLNHPIDVAIALENQDGAWVYFIKEEIKPQDTIMAYVCNSPASKHKIDYKKSGEKIALSTCEEYNADYTAKTKKSPCKEVPKKLVDIETKILAGDNQAPLPNQKVLLKNMEGKEMQSAMTDEFGDFTFKNVDAHEKHIIELELDPKLTVEEKIFLATQTGMIVGEFSKEKTFIFKYDLLQKDIQKLLPISEEDPVMIMNNFKSSGRSETIFKQSIYYAPQEFALNPDAKKTLDKIAGILMEEKVLKLEVFSHSDSRGDDQANLILSQKRADEVLNYLASKGVDKSRLKAQGVGETKLLNRCKNDIKCSEKEHSLNRRTEFKLMR